MDVFTSGIRSRVRTCRPGAETLEPRCLLAAPTLIQAVGKLVKSAEGKAVTAQVASFTGNSTTAKPSDFLATIHWGDGSASFGMVSKAGKAGQFQVKGKHAYKDGLDLHQIAIDVLAKATGAQAAAQSSAKISGASYHATAGAINAFSGTPSPNMVLGTFKILDKTNAASLQASVSYSDGSAGAASIVAIPGVKNGYAVIGDHVFASPTPTGGGVSQVSIFSTAKHAPGFILSDPTVVTPRNTWTIMVYMEADNNLETAAISNLIQMEEATANLPDTVHFTVFLHQENDPNTGLPPILTGNNSQAWTGAREAVMAPSLNGSVVMTNFNTNLGEQNSGDPAALDQFIAWSAANAPAQHYALVVWGHGGGVFGISFHDANIPGPTHLSVPGLAAALQSSHTKVDLLAFDACFMVGAETTSALSPYVGAIVGCEGDVPTSGYEYDQAFEALAVNPGQVSAPALGAGILQSVAVGFNIDPSVLPMQTQSVIDTTKLAALDAALKNFTSTALTFIAPGTLAATALSVARGHAADFVESGWPFSDFIDLGAFMQSVRDNGATPSPVAVAAQGVLAALGPAVIARKVDTISSSGLSIYMPILGTVSPAYLAQYNAFFAATGWDAFLSVF
jgi:Clostripain family